ncbi:hypothetical protein KIL84_004748 [Mauremys mutica]|uniref:Uncharacterized protein n=1 Tax=Mauremys mutica TaxID=74926 RepID=A0A9D4B776_9SAUR|nr:hypothetical protein KIL84_004748 [Mauremys mutica]
MLFVIQIAACIVSGVRNIISFMTLFLLSEVPVPIVVLPDKESDKITALARIGGGYNRPEDTKPSLAQPLDTWAVVAPLAFYLFPSLLLPFPKAPTSHPWPSPSLLQPPAPTRHPPPAARCVPAGGGGLTGEG